MLVQEEEKLKKMKNHYVHLMIHDGASCRKVKPDKKDKKKGKTPLKVNEDGVQKENKCYFYQENIHFKRIILKGRCIREKKVCFIFP